MNYLYDTAFQKRYQFRIFSIMSDILRCNYLLIKFFMSQKTLFCIGGKLEIFMLD